MVKLEFGFLSTFWMYLRFEEIGAKPNSFDPIFYLVRQMIIFDG